MKNGKLKIWELSLLLALCVSLCWGVFLQGRQTELAGKLIRLHVIAEDDSPAEQELKLRVRDAVLEQLAPLTESAASAEQARSAIQADLPLLEQAAEAAAPGKDVTVLFGPESYGTRSSGGCTLPAGTYCSLRVVIGRGGGHNWWGVIFPQLTDFASGGSADAAKLLGEKDFALITEDCGGVQVRFRFLEWLEELRELFR